MQIENKIFWINLEKIQNALLKSDAEFSDYLGLNLADYLKSKCAQNFLPLNCVFECAEKLNFHFEDLLKDNFSTTSILSKIEGTYSIQKRYSEATYSKTRQTGNILSYIERTKGERAKLNLLRKFQLTDDFIFQGSNNVNILLISDMAQYLKKTYNLSPCEFEEIGRMTPFTSMNLDLAGKLSQKKNICEVLDYFVSELSVCFDKNFSYQITNMTNGYAIIEASPNRYVSDELGTTPNQLGNELTCLTRMGVISSIAWFRYKKFIQVKKFSSIYSGDSSNRYLLDLSPFSKSSSFIQNNTFNFTSIYQ
jgi:hypothetical protein